MQSIDWEEFGMNAFENLEDTHSALDLAASVVTVTHAIENGFMVPDSDRALAKQDCAKLREFIKFAEKILSE